MQLAMRIRDRHIFRACVWLAIACSLAGCSQAPREIAPVSGLVKMKGKPLANARVVFLPESTPAIGRGVTSFGETDAAGRYTLTTADGRPGAIVGEHRVRISTRKRTTTDGGESAVETVRETVPDKYNANSTLTFVVSEQGADAAEFSLD